MRVEQIEQVAPSEKVQQRRGLVFGGIALLLLVFAVQVVSVVRQESLTWDEVVAPFRGAPPPPVSVQSLHSKRFRSGLPA